MLPVTKTFGSIYGSFFAKSRLGSIWEKLEDPI